MATQPEQTGVSISDLLVIETSDFPESNADGSMTVPAGEEQFLAEFEPATDQIRAKLHAYGATNASDVRFRIRYGQNIAFTTESPLGGVNDLYSFTDAMGYPVTSTDTVQIVAINDSSSDIDLVARMLVEVS